MNNVTVRQVSGRTDGVIEFRVEYKPDNNDAAEVDRLQAELSRAQSDRDKNECRLEEIVGHMFDTAKSHGLDIGRMCEDWIGAMDEEIRRLEEEVANRSQSEYTTAQARDACIRAGIGWCGSSAADNIERMVGYCLDLAAKLDCAKAALE